MKMKLQILHEHHRGFGASINRNVELAICGYIKSKKDNKKKGVAGAKNNRSQPRPASVKNFRI